MAGYPGYGGVYGARCAAEQLPYNKPDNKRARYVIELRSGTIERTGIRQGSKAKMPLGI